MLFAAFNTHIRFTTDLDSFLQKETLSEKPDPCYNTHTDKKRTGVIGKCRNFFTDPEFLLYITSLLRQLPSPCES